MLVQDEKNSTHNQLPTIEALQTWYEENLRNNTAKRLRENDKEVKKNSFFNTFRKFEQREDQPSNGPKTEHKYYKRYQAYIEEETKRKATEIEELEKLIQFEKFFLRWERRRCKERNHSNHHGSNPATRYRVDRINDLKRQMEHLLTDSKEAWEYYHKRQFIEDIEDIRDQRLIKVPYVDMAKRKVMDSLDIGIPVYIVGHLGSGKTQLALEAAIDYTIENKLQTELEEKLEEWFSKNPHVTEGEAIEKFSQLNQERRQYYKNILVNGDKNEIEALQPLFISGSHNLTYEDMFIEKTLSLKQSFSQGSFSDYLNMIIGDFYTWMDKHKEKLEQMTEEEQLQLKIQIWKSFSDLLVASNSAFGTEIKMIEKEILIAVKEGRPVIVDELNTIAMQNLIGLNDILQRHVGSTAYITGVGPVMIKPGFGFIGTGNLSTERVNYEGTNELNPAFKSRFVTIEYNYVPQSITGSLEDQEDSDGNQLFRVIITELANPDGSIELPNAKRTLEELFRFAQLSKVTQNVFVGKWKDSVSHGDSRVEDVELKESVLSVRNILHVLDNWNLGEEKDLSKALWDGFISSITDPDDQNFILSQAVRFGFFPASEGWKVETKAIGEGTTTYEEIRKSPYRYTRQATESLSYLDVIQCVFGKGPERRELPKELSELFKNDSEKPNIDLNKYQQLEQEVSHLERSKQLLEHLEEKDRDR